MPRPIVRSAIAVCGMFAATLGVVLGCSERRAPLSSNDPPISEPSPPRNAPLMRTQPPVPLVPDDEAAQLPHERITSTVHPPVGARPEVDFPLSAPPAPPDGGDPPQDSDPSAAEPAARPSKKTPADPIQRNGPIFVDWPQPKLTLVFTGQQNGYIEPCGCAGLDNQKGGLSRRMTMLESLKAKGWDVLALDLGNQVRRRGRQAELKLATTFKGLRAMNYAVVGLGDDDLRLPVGALVEPLAEFGEGGGPLVSANVGLFSFVESEAAGLSRRYAILQRGGWKIGVTTVLGEEYRRSVDSAELETMPARDALAEVMPKLQGQCDLIVVLSYAPVEESMQWAEDFPIDYLVTAGGPDEPPAVPATIPGTKTRLVEVGRKGMYAVAIGLYDDPQRPVRFQRVPLDARFTPADEVQQLLVEYQEALRVLGLSGLGIEPKPHPSGRQFVGSQTCAQCHTQAYDVWSNTPHAHATDTLVHLSPPRHYDAECLSCHVTGWEPQRYFPYLTGFLGLAKTPHLTANGCENCHGGGAAHAAAELGETEVSDAELAALRQQMRVSLEQAEQTCLKCHDLDNSPAFDFDKYWPEVEHYGKD